MSAQLYWRERLIARNPIYSEPLREVMYNFRPHRRAMDDTWPHAIARAVLLEDYTAWHKEVYLKPYGDVSFFRDNPKKLPRPLGQLEFFSTISPWLYVRGKKEQVRAYLVPHKVCVEGRWVSTLKNRYFVRLCPWEAHVAAFHVNTGMDVNETPLPFDPIAASLAASATYGQLPKPTKLP